MPDLVSQFKLIETFMSPYIELGQDGSAISETNSMFNTVVKLLGGLEDERIQSEKDYLL